MAVPKKRTGHSAQGKRRANWKATKPETTVCSNCGQPVLAHTVCTACGYYKGEPVRLKDKAEAVTEVKKPAKKAKKAAPAEEAPKAAEAVVEAEVVEEAPKETTRKRATKKTAAEAPAAEVKEEKTEEAAE